jgi:hypothetical protein
MSEADRWSMAGANILAPDLLDRIRDIVKQQPIIVEHRLYRGGSAPIRLIFDEYEDFLNHLKSRAKLGDRFLVWGFGDLCRNDNWLADGKYPDEAGRTPRGGVY